MRKILDNIGKYLLNFVAFLAMGLVIGLICGFVGTVFHECISFAVGLRASNTWIIYLLPLGGFAIAALYRVTNKPVTTDHVIKSIIDEKPISIVMAPLIFVSTVATQLVGGSGGREGAAIQLGGCLGYNIGKLVRMKGRELKIITRCGISAVFAAMFQTPLGATLFAMEVVDVGHLYYIDLIPCLASALTASTLAGFLGTDSGIPKLAQVPGLSAANMGWVVLLAVLIAGISIIFCLGLKKGEALFEKILPNTMVRGAVGGTVILGATLLVGNQNFNGSGINLITMAMEGNTEWWFFIAKMAFTIVTVGCCFKGGEIVPSFAIGAMFGCLFSKIVGIDPAFGAAVGMVAMFCCMVNCPLASLLIGIELFGAGGIYYFAAVCAISFLLSGNFGLYKTQNILYSKILDIARGR